MFPLYSPLKEYWVLSCKNSLTFWRINIYFSQKLNLENRYHSHIRMITVAWQQQVSFDAFSAWHFGQLISQIFY